MADLKKPVDPQAEIEMQIGELEERVDRLRAIYEQYFMGYEKLEPTVPRKDVDRRFTVLRKANIRNTALRFRFNVVTQKFNTYAMYWTRICRQIEEGTFKRHIVRANKRFGGTTRRAEELSIDVDLGDFDDFDSESETADALAEAEASARTEPPQMTMPKSSPRLEMMDMDTDTARTDRPRAPSPSFVEIEDELSPDSLPPASQQPRLARHAVLPAGSRQRLLVKKGPPSSRGDAMPSAPEHTPQPMRARLPSVPETDLPPMRRPMPSTPEHAPSTSVIRAASPQQGHVHRPPPGVVRPQISPTGTSVNRVPVAKPAPNPAPSVQRVPAAAANPAPSVQRTPATAPNPALGRTPSTQPAATGSPSSVPRVPAARVPIGLPSSVARVPAAADAKAPPAPASDRKVPIPPPSQRSPVARPGGPMPAAVLPDSERNPVPSRRPPPPLPSALKKP